VLFLNAKVCILRRPQSPWTHSTDRTRGRRTERRRRSGGRKTSSRDCVGLLRQRVPRHGAVWEDRQKGERGNVPPESGERGREREESPGTELGNGGVNRSRGEGRILATRRWKEEGLKECG